MNSQQSPTTEHRPRAAPAFVVVDPGLTLSDDFVGARSIELSCHWSLDLILTEDGMSSLVVKWDSESKTGLKSVGIGKGIAIYYK